mmetsp:Transcript_6030/g.13299  ORF Transcript_6030/g.13299 Transcript_6030/m.13299 type:complete len:404 (-) Transcript_6030:57-1268(-)
MSGPYGGCGPYGEPWSEGGGYGKGKAGKEDWPGDACGGGKPWGPWKGCGKDDWWKGGGKEWPMWGKGGKGFGMGGCPPGGGEWDPSGDSSGSKAGPDKGKPKGGYDPTWGDGEPWQKGGSGDAWSGGKGYQAWKSSGAESSKSKPYDSQKAMSKGKAGPGKAAQPWKPLQTPNTVVLFSSEALEAGFELKVAEAVQNLAVGSGFSTAEEVRKATSHTCFIDFPHMDAVKAFMSATQGKMSINNVEYRLETVTSQEAGSSQQDGEEVGNASEQTEVPTDTLIVQRIWDLSEATIWEAFSSVGSVREVKVPKNWAGKPKSFAFVSFNSVSEAQTALSRFQLGGLKIGEQRVFVGFAHPQSTEAIVQAKARKQAEDAQLLESKKKALTGINGGMWAEYLKHCSQNS